MIDSGISEIFDPKGPGCGRISYNLCKKFGLTAECLIYDRVAVERTIFSLPVDDEAVDIPTNEGARDSSVREKKDT